MLNRGLSGYERSNGEVPSEVDSWSSNHTTLRLDDSIEGKEFKLEERDVVVMMDRSVLETEKERDKIHKELEVIEVQL